MTNFDNYFSIFIIAVNKQSNFYNSYLLKSCSRNERRGYFLKIPVTKKMTKIYEIWLCKNSDRFFKIDQSGMSFLVINYNDSCTCITVTVILLKSTTQINTLELFPIHSVCDLI